MFPFQLAFMEIHMQQMDHIDAIRWLDTDACAYMAERSRGHRVCSYEAAVDRKKKRNEQMRLTQNRMRSTRFGCGSPNGIEKLFNFHWKIRKFHELFDSCRVAGVNIWIKLSALTHSSVEIWWWLRVCRHAAHRCETANEFTFDCPWLRCVHKSMLISFIVRLHFDSWSVCVSKGFPAFHSIGEWPIANDENVQKCVSEGLLSCLSCGRRRPPPPLSSPWSRMHIAHWPFQLRVLLALCKDRTWQQWFPQTPCEFKIIVYWDTDAILSGDAAVKPIEIESQTW